jgi:hypothetical protein
MRRMASAKPRVLARGCALLAVALTVCALPCRAASTFIEGAGGIVASIDGATGRYEVRSNQLGRTPAATPCGR